MPSKDSGRTPIVSRRCEIWRALNPASTSSRHWLVAINEQLPALPLPRTVKLSTRLLKRTVGPDANHIKRLSARLGYLIPTCAPKKTLAFLAVRLEFPEANADTEAMPVDLCRNVRTSALMLLSPLIFLR